MAHTTFNVLLDGVPVVRAEVAAISASLDALPCDDRAPWAALFEHLIESDPKNIITAERSPAGETNDVIFRVGVSPVLAAFGAALRAYEVFRRGRHDETPRSGCGDPSVGGAGAGVESAPATEAT